MSLIKTLSHNRILNFFDCRDGAGSIISSEGSAVWTATAPLGTGTENALIINAEAAKKALTSGNLESPAATSDWAFMALVNFDATIATFALGDDASNHLISIGIGAVSVTGATGSIGISPSPAILSATLYKVLVTFDLDGDIELRFAEPGTDLSTTADGTADVTASGPVSSIDNTINVASLLGNADVILYGAQMVEFTNGSMTNEVITKADACMEAWYVGNKRHYEILEEDV